MATNKETFKDKVVTYFKGVKTEFFKITWPDKKQVFGETVWVIGIVLVFTLAVLLLDTVFGAVLGKIQIH